MESRSQNTENYKLSNSNGIEIEFISYGGRLKSIKTPDRNGIIEDILLGYNTLEEYLAGDYYIGALCGRYANRIENGVYMSDGKKIQLTQNNDGNHLHGGFTGFHAKLWNVTKNGNSYVLSLHSEDGEEGYPGNVDVEVTYSLTDDNKLIIDYKAVTDKPTHINLTSHGYFNLGGEGNGNITNHFLKLNADHFTPLTEKSVPSGEIRSVAGIAMDFRETKKVISALETNYEQIELVGGIDHNWILNGRENELKPAAELYEEQSGRVMEMYTTQPGVQVYVGLHFNGEKGKSGKSYNKYGGIAIEGQHFPNSPNIHEFPSTLIKPGQTYKQRCIYKFLTR